jgi:membrane protease YdiL (CAAX protease family)
MTELVKHRVPLMAQLVIALAYLGLLTSITAFADTKEIKVTDWDSTTIWEMKINQVVGVILVFILPVILFSSFARKERLTFLQMNQPPTITLLLTAFTICIIAMPLVGYLQQINAELHLPSAMASTEEWMRDKEKEATAITEAFFIDKSTSSLFVNLFVVAIMAGLSEELFFRGLIQRLFIDNKMNVHVAVWITAILFSAFHFQFFGFIPRVILGAVLGYLYAFTGNLWTSILAHTVNNGFAVIAAHLFGESITEAENANSTQITLSVALLSAALVIGQLWYIQKYSKRNLLVNP